jgi:outer membrane protein assembly factor BamB
MARRQYVSFLGERHRDIAFTDRGPDPTRWVLLFMAVIAAAISVWWFGFRDVDRVIATERVLNDTTVPTLLNPTAIESSGAEPADVRLDCPTLVEEWTMFQGGIERAGCLSTLQITDPEIIWTAEIGLNGWRNNPVVEDGSVFVGSAGVVQFTGDRRDGIYSLDLRTGAQRWLYTTELDVNSVAVSNGTVVGVGDEGRVWALSARDGTLLWTDDLGVGVLGDPLFLKNTDGEDVVIVGDLNGVITAYNVRDGAKVWGTAAPRLNGPIRGGASSDGEHIFAASEFGDVIALNLSGQTVWRIEQLEIRPGAGRAGVSTAPTIAGELLILGIVRDGLTSDPALRALNKETGEEVWASEDIASLKAGQWSNLRSSPAIAGDYVVFGAGYGNELVVVDRLQGDTLWSSEVGAYCYPQWPSPVINNGIDGDGNALSLAYLARHDGGLYAVNLQTREESWKIYLGDHEGNGDFPLEHAESGFCNWGPESGASILGSPAVASNGMIVVGTLQGHIMAVGDSDWDI